MSDFNVRKMLKSDLETVIMLLADDKLGKFREKNTPLIHEDYICAFEQLDRDTNHFVGIFEINGEIIGCLQISYIPGLTRGGSLRGQIEGVRVASAFRGKGYGAKMINWAIAECRRRGCKLVQLTSDKKRPDAIQFYEKIGFVKSHEGLKLIF